MLLRSYSLVVSTSSSLSLFVFCLIVLSVAESRFFSSSSYCGLILIKKKFIYFSLCRICAAVHRLSLVAVRRFLIVVTPHHRVQALGSVIAVLGLSCPTTCGIFPDQGSNLCPLHWQMDS